MRDINYYIEKEIEEFASKYYGSPILEELVELKKSAEAWFLRYEQSIKEYYYNRKKEDKYSISHCYKSFKFRLTFLDNGHFQISLDHSYSHSSKVFDKKIKDSYFKDPGYVYFLESEFGWKIGKTRDLTKRNNVFEVKLPFRFAVRHCIKSRDISRLEIYFHNYFKEKRINGEWFLITQDDIKDVVSKTEGCILRTYHPGRDIFIERKYLTQIQSL